MIDPAARIRKLENDLADARETISQLLEQFGGAGWYPPQSLCLQPREVEVLQVLVRRFGVVTNEQLVTTMFAHRPGMEVPGYPLLKVYVCKIRRQLRRFELEIKTHWGIGYELPEASRVALLNWDGREAKADETRDRDMRKMYAEDYPADLRDQVRAWRGEGLFRADVVELVKERWPGQFDWIRNHHIDVLMGTPTPEPKEPGRRGRKPSADPQPVARKYAAPSLGGPAWSRPKVSA